MPDINMLFMEINSSGAMIKASTLPDLVGQILFSGLEIVLTLWLLRPATFEGIRELWDRKWHLQQEGSADTQLTSD